MWRLAVCTAARSVVLLHMCAGKIIKNARCGQSRALFEWNFHISCTGVLFRVTGRTDLLSNLPVRDGSETSKVENRNADRKHGFWQNYTNLLQS